MDVCNYAESESMSVDSSQALPDTEERNGNRENRHIFAIVVTEEEEEEIRGFMQFCEISIVGVPALEVPAPMLETSCHVFAILVTEEEEEMIRGFMQFSDMNIVVAPAPEVPLAPVVENPHVFAILVTEEEEEMRNDPGIYAIQ
jgi:hypothetical protein